MSTQGMSIPTFAFPASNLNEEERYYRAFATYPTGHYLFNQHGIWHGGIHLDGDLVGKGVCAIANGEVVAYRVNDEYPTDDNGAEYSTGFFLLRHRLEYPEGNPLTLFSLYMHTAKTGDYPQGFAQYTVQSGDVLSRISQRHNMTLDALRALNPAVANTDTIQPGQILKVATGKSAFPVDFAERPADEVHLLDEPIPVKAGDLVALPGVFDHKPEQARKLVHLEVFTGDDVEAFAETAKSHGDELKPKGIGFDWATVFAESSDDGASLFTNLLTWLQEVAAGAVNPPLQLNALFTPVFETLGNQGSEISLRFVEFAARSQLVRKMFSQYIVKHPSEWAQPAQDSLCRQMSTHCQEVEDSDGETHYTNEATRAEQLEFFSHCTGLEGFPQTAEVFHFHPLALAANIGLKHYGGYRLKRGDNDTAKRWAGEAGEQQGEYVKELQQDLLRLGYWVSHPGSTQDKGMKCDGDFGESTENALKTFQLEHFVFDAEGNVDATQKPKITGVLDPETAVRIKEKVAVIGDKAWDRPGHLTDGVLFYQLPPSKGYYRREKIEYGKRSIPAFRVFDDDDAEWLLADCWGTKKQIDFLKNLGDTWLETSEGTPRTVANVKGEQQPVKPFGVGDISGFNKGKMPGHSTHQNGDAADLNRFGSENGICATNYFRSIFDRNQTYELCKLLVANGAKRILFNCHYIIKNIEIAQELEKHHDHVHVDGPEYDGTEPMLAARFTTCVDCTLFSDCEERIYKVLHQGRWKDYDRILSYDNRRKGVARLYRNNQLLCKTKSEWGR